MAKNSFVRFLLTAVMFLNCNSSFDPLYLREDTPKHYLYSPLIHSGESAVQVMVIHEICCEFSNLAQQKFEACVQGREKLAIHTDLNERVLDETARTTAEARERVRMTIETQNIIRACGAVHRSVNRILFISRIFLITDDVMACRLPNA